MLRQISSSQLSEIEAFWNIEGGWGDWKQDYRIGQLTAISAEPNRDRKRRQRPYTAEDFALRPREAKNRANKDDRVERMRKSLDMMAQKKKKK
jgi:hypothetical protein